MISRVRRSSATASSSLAALTRRLGLDHDDLILAQLAEALSALPLALGRPPGSAHPVAGGRARQGGVVLVSLGAWPGTHRDAPPAGGATLAMDLAANGRG